MEFRANAPFVAPNACGIERSEGTSGSSRSGTAPFSLCPGTAGQGSNASLRLKRAFDLVVGGSLLLVVMPLMLLIAAAIALENRGPIVFVQYRIGRNGRSFRMLKFRTLPDHADDGCRRVLTRYDARLTALARFLRETGLDELPQLVNVIGGTMSLVGPRPLVEADAFACIKPCAERFLVPPGITGLAQVRGRNSVPLLKRLRDDALYIRRRSLRLDMLILIQTLLVPFSPDNAYPCGSTVRNADRGMN